MLEVPKQAIICDVISHYRYCCGNTLLNLMSDNICNLVKMFGAMHFIYHINRSIATKVDSNYWSY